MPGHDRSVAYDTELAERVRDLIESEPGLTEKRMFGGLAFLIGGTLAVSASGKGGLLVRVDPARTDALAAEPHVEPFEMRGKAMAGWLHVHTDAVTEHDDLARWVALGVAAARAQPKT